MTFVDTSALLAVMVEPDAFHEAARGAWERLLTDGEALFTTNYVLVETCALLQRRFGVTAVGAFATDIAPVLNVIWVEDSAHRSALSMLLASGRRELSLVDCASFVAMRDRSLGTVFTFDAHFAEQGFTAVPGVGPPAAAGEQHGTQ